MEKHVVFLSWHNSLPGYLTGLYKILPYKKSFISRNHIQGRLIDNSLMANPNSYKLNSDALVVNKLNEIKATHVVVWNGDFNDNERGFQLPLINRLRNIPGLKMVFCEHGWLPQSSTFTIDNEGSNGSSSVSKSSQIPYTSNKNAINSKRLEYNSPAYSGSYIYLPLQINTDTQVALYSPYFKDMAEFIKHVTGLFPDKKIIVKVHPKDSESNKQKYKRFCNKPNIVYVDDKNNISYIKGAERVIAINSTVVNEALLFNKPVMTYGINYFSNKGVTYEVSNISDLEYQKKFLSFNPNANKVESYITMLLDLQLTRNNFTLNKVQSFFN
jgi:hypothetical protein